MQKGNNKDLDNLLGKLGNLKFYYVVFWRNRTTNWNRCWEAVGLLDVHLHEAVLKNSKLEFLDKTTKIFLHRCKPGYQLNVGDKEVEILQEFQNPTEFAERQLSFLGFLEWHKTEMTLVRDIKFDAVKPEEKYLYFEVTFREIGLDVTAFWAGEGTLEIRIEDNIALLFHLNGEYLGSTSEFQKGELQHGLRLIVANKEVKLVGTIATPAKWDRRSMMPKVKSASMTPYLGKYTDWPQVLMELSFDKRRVMFDTLIGKNGEEGTLVVQLSLNRAILRDKSGDCLGIKYVDEADLKPGAITTIGEHQITITKVIETQNEYWGKLMMFAAKRAASGNSDPSQMNWETTVASKTHWENPREHPIVLTVPEGILVDDEERQHTSITVPRSLVRLLNQCQRKILAFLHECIMGRKVLGQWGCIIAGKGEEYTLPCLVYAHIALLEPSLSWGVLILGTVEDLVNLHHFYKDKFGDEGPAVHIVKETNTIKHHEKLKDIFLLPYEMVLFFMDDIVNSAIDLLICVDAPQLKTQPDDIRAALNQLDIGARVVTSAISLRDNFSDLLMCAKLAVPANAKKFHLMTKKSQMKELYEKCSGFMMSLEEYDEDIEMTE